MTKEKMVSKIIEIKEFNKEQLEAEVGNARVRLNAEQLKLDGLDQEYKKTTVDLARKQAGAIHAPEIELFHTYLKHLTKQIDQQKSVVAAHAAEVDRKQKAMVEVFKEQCLFEKLHDKIIHEQAKGISKNEQKEADFAYLCRKVWK
ncbi:MAG TPA: flagellar export protein FliJ [Nitrospirota bacterium]|nr:flagellar export protein FliJ [Nitrospirota bacterium]